MALNRAVIYLDHLKKFGSPPFPVANLSSRWVSSFLDRLRTYSVSFVSSVVETSSAAGYSQMVTDVHHRGTERTEDSQRLLLLYYTLNTARNQKYSTSRIGSRKFYAFPQCTGLHRRASARARAGGSGAATQ